MDNPDLSHIHESLREMAVPISSLQFDPKNARKHDRRNLDAIKTSLEKFGFRQPIIVQKQGMIVRAGNGRMMASQELGWTHIPALIVDEAEAAAVAYAIADNRTAELAEWDFDVLSDYLQMLPEEYLENVGFDENELATLLTHSEDWAKMEEDAKAGIESKVKKQMSQSGTGEASREVNVDDFGDDEFDHECPRCKFRFND